MSARVMWMRNSTCMNDFTEIQHGNEMLGRCLMGANAGKALFDSLNSIVPAGADRAIQLFRQWWADMRAATFIACLSEHDDHDVNRRRKRTPDRHVKGTPLRIVQVVHGRDPRVSRSAPFMMRAKCTSIATAVRGSGQGCSPTSGSRSCEDADTDDPFSRLGLSGSRSPAWR